MVTQIVKIFPSFKGVKDVITSSDAEIITNAGKVVLQDSIKMSAVKEEIEKRYSDKPVDNEPIVVEFTEQ